MCTCLISIVCVCVQDKVKDWVLSGEDGTAATVTDQQYVVRPTQDSAELGAVVSRGVNFAPSRAPSTFLQANATSPTSDGPQLGSRAVDKEKEALYVRLMSGVGGGGRVMKSLCVIMQHSDS